MIDKAAHLKNFDEKARQTKILNRLTELSETEKERNDAQVMARATNQFNGPRFMSKYQRITLAQQFVLVCLAFLMAFVLSVVFGAIVRGKRLQAPQIPTPHYKLIPQSIK